MRNVLVLPAVIFLSSAALMSGAAVRYEAKIWRAVQTYELASLSKNLNGHVRELVAMKCNFRGEDIHHMKPNWYERSIWQPVAGETGKFAYVPMVVAKPDLK